MTASLRLVPAAQPEAEPVAPVTAGDPDGDVGLFAMSAASAEQVTGQIRTLLDRGWEYVALAYQGQAFLALGYPDWDAYVDARFGDLRITVPREHRHHAVAALSGASMSIRAIAKLLGVGVGTIHREITGTADVSDGIPDSEIPPPSTLGRDGKHYPRRRPPITALCRTCGEAHAGDPSQCPWELYAQGTGPQPSAPPPGGSEAPAIRARGGSGPSPQSRTTARTVTNKKPSEPPNQAAPARTGGTSSLLDTIERAACLLDQMPGFEQLDAKLDTAVDAETPERDRKELTGRIRELERALRDQVAVFASLLERLGEIAVDLEPR